MNKNIKRNIAIDFIRINAIVYIIFIHHIKDYTSSIKYYGVDTIITYISMGMFIYISGYLLSKQKQSISSFKEAKEILIKRLLRIYPLYSLSLFLFLMIPVTNVSFESWVLHSLIPLDSILAPIWVKPIITLWFVSVIIFCYFFFIVSIYKYTFLRFSLIFIFVWTILIFLNIFWGLIDKRLIIYLPLFAIGILSAKNDSLMLKLKTTLFVLLFCIICIFASIEYFNFTTSKLKYILQIIFMTCSIVPIMAFADFATHSMNNYVRNIICKMSYASFCMYLFHRVIFKLMLQIYTPNSDSIIILYLILLGIPLVYFISKFIQDYYNNILFKNISNK